MAGMPVGINFSEQKQLRKLKKIFDRQEADQ